MYMFFATQDEVDDIDLGFQVSKSFKVLSCLCKRWNSTEEIYFITKYIPSTVLHAESFYDHSRNLWKLKNINR